MSVWLSALVTAIYVGVCIEQFAKGNVPMGIAYAGWAFANVGVILALK